MARRVLPNHVGFIPDGNRRWAADQGLRKQSGYQAGIEPGSALIVFMPGHCWTMMESLRIDYGTQ